MKKFLMAMMLAMVMTLGVGIGNAQMMNPQTKGNPGLQKDMNRQMQSGNMMGLGGTGMMGSNMMGNMMGSGGMGMMNCPMMGNMMGSGGMGMMNYPMMGFAVGGQSRQQVANYEKFINDTREMRRKLNNMRFDYKEAMWNPKTSLKNLRDMAERIGKLQMEIQQKMSR